MAWIEGLVRVAVLNLVPLWGFGYEHWTPGTTLALYWLQTVIGIPVTAALIVMHRNQTHKAGHYKGLLVALPDGSGLAPATSTYLANFLWMAIPFTAAHGVFLGFLLGLIWQSDAGAVNHDDLRVGLVATVNVMAVGFAFDVFGLRARTFAWLEKRAIGVLQRMVLVHFVIIFGLGAAVFADQAAETFFAVFLGLKVVFEVLSEMPAWNPKEASAWVARIMNRIGGPGSDFAADWRRMSEEERETVRLAEETIESLQAPGRSPR